MNLIPHDAFNSRVRSAIEEASGLAAAVFDQVFQIPEGHALETTFGDR